MRYFALEEAESVIPKLEEIYGRVITLQDNLQKKIQNFNRLEKTQTADPVSLVLGRSQIDFLASQIQDEMRQVADLGAIPKGLDPYLVDFLGKVRGQDVYFCWKFGEKFISYCHGLEEGYTSRQMIPIELDAPKFKD